MIGRLKKMGGAVLAGALLLALGAGCSGKKEPVSLDPQNPVTINIWHYYNGAQKTAFDQLIAEFNESVGREKGVVVEGVNQGSVSKLTEAIIDSAQNKVGTDPVPNIFAAYADTAYQIDSMGLVTDLSQYLTQAELDAAILNELVSRIVVHSPVRENGRKQVQIDLYFTYVGQIRIPLKIGRESLNESEPA